jgi:CRISPR-associated protein Cmr2
VSIANKILAEVPPDLDPEACAKAARGAARARWRDIAHGVLAGRGRPVIARGVDELWNEQVEDVLEFYAVWVALAEDYAAARRQAEQALSGRKNLRDFRSWRHDRLGAPKSSLDGARVSVLGDNRDGVGFRRLRISAGEQLDAIGLIKRAGFDPEQFVPLVNIAAGEWIERAAKEAPEELAAVRRACRERGIPQVQRPELPVVASFPFDATVLYPSRWPTLLKEIETPQKDPATARDWGGAHVRPLLKRMCGELPPSYVACLVADGDRMGEAIDSLGAPKDNRGFSRRLAQFPRAARRIVEQHLGSLTYAGGDDVLAFLPAATAPHCAAALAKEFSAGLRGAVGDRPPPTLSVGIAVGHVLEPMSILLDLARQAEREAKKAGRNALAIIVDKRSGGQRRVAASWKRDPVTRLRLDAKLLQGSLSTRKVHELEALLRRFPGPCQVAARPEAARAIAVYATDILAHSQEGSKASLADIGVEPTGDYALLRQDFAAAIDRILVARSLREWGFA